MLELGVGPADYNPRNYHLVRSGAAVVVLGLEDTADFDLGERDMDELAEAVAGGFAHWTVFYHRGIMAPRGIPYVLDLALCRFQRITF